jgi:tetratricopeptide (TPR) repeat protein
MRILSNHCFPGDQAHDVLCFSGKHNDYSYFDGQSPCYFLDILKKMPPGWEPDIIVFKSPLYFAVPYGIEDSPYPTVLLLDDWFGGVDYLPDTFAKFDYIFTDKTSVAMLSTLGFSNVGYWPLFAFPPSLFHLMPGEQRTYDVTFTGNFNVNVQGKRLPWLRRLAALDKKYNIRLFHHAWHEEYTRILNQSKIVFNHSIKREMNQRAFEAPACGALLFMEEDNLEVRDFFTPGKECVLFNDANFEELLIHYLTREDERVAIAQKGYERAQDFSVPRLFNGLVDKIQILGLRAGWGRSGKRIYSSLPQHRDFVQTSLAKFGRGESTVKNVAILISRPSIDSLVLNDCAVILMTYADDIKATGDPLDIGRIVSNALTMLTRAESGMPGFLTPLFNMAQMLVAAGKPQDAAEIFRRLFASAPLVSYEQCKGLVYPLQYSYPLRVEWSMAIAGVLPDPAAMAQARHRLIRFFCAANLAAIALGGERPSQDEAIYWYEQAYSLVPGNPHVLLPLARLYLAKNHGRTREMCAALLAVNPFCIDFWKEWAVHLIKDNCVDEARQFIGSCLLCLSRLQMATPEMIGEFENLAKQFDVRD